MNRAKLQSNNFFRCLKMILQLSLSTTWKKPSALKESPKNFLTSTQKNFIKSKTFWKVIPNFKPNQKRTDLQPNSLQKNFSDRLSFCISCRKKVGSALKKIQRGGQVHKILCATFSKKALPQEKIFLMIVLSRFFIPRSMRTEVFKMMCTQN